MRKTIHFEGIPGSGKSTAAEQMYGLLRSNGVDANWWLEEAADHPIMPRERRALSGTSKFPQICLEAWETFLNASSSTAILDGCAFQHTVRFLWANLATREQISAYFEQWQRVSPDTAIVYLVVADPSSHYDLVLSERGDAWTKKLYAYVERTPVGIAKGFVGKVGFVEFWSRYQQLCIDLLGTAQVPVQHINARSWYAADLQGLATKYALFT